MKFCIVVKTRAQVAELAWRLKHDLEGSPVWAPGSEGTDLAESIKAFWACARGTLILNAAAATQGINLPSDTELLVSSGVPQVYRQQFESRLFRTRVNAPETRAKEGP